MTFEALARAGFKGVSIPWNAGSELGAGGDSRYEEAGGCWGGTNVPFSSFKLRFMRELKCGHRMDLTNEAVRKTYLNMWLETPRGHDI